MAGQPLTRARKAKRAEKKELRAKGVLPKRVTKAKKDPARSDPARKDDLVFDHTPEAWAEFIRLFIINARQDVACKATGIPRQTVYYRRKKDPAFDEAFQEAKVISNGRLIDEAVRRAVDGVDKPIYYQGEKVDTVREYSDSLLQFMLINSGDPQFKKDNAEPETPESNIDTSVLSDSTLKELMDARKSAK